MGRYNLNLSLIAVILCFFFNNIHTATSQLPPNPIGDLACTLLKPCGEGTCVVSNTTLLGFDCICKPGWQQIKVGALTYPACLIPNCTVDFQCGNGAPPPPAPPSQPLPSPCLWCGDGNCVANETGQYNCQCNVGSSNLFGQSTFACFKQCYFGADCNSVGLGPPPPPPNTSSGSPNTKTGPSATPPSTRSGSPNTKTGKNGAPNSMKNLQALSMLVLSSVVFTWI